MKYWGIILIWIGISCGYIAITMDTSIESGLGRVENLGLMNKQTNLFIVSGFSLIAGLLLFGLIVISGKNSSNESRICPYCAEKIKENAKICRFCQKESNLLSCGGVENTNKTISFIVIGVIIIVFIAVGYQLDSNNRIKEEKLRMGSDDISKYIQNIKQYPQDYDDCVRASATITYGQKGSPSSENAKKMLIEKKCSRFAIYAN